MLSLDLFDSRYERDLREGAVDDLEARRIDDLNDRMQDLLARAREAKTPEHKAGLKREFDKVKDERDSYYKVREAGIPGNVPVEKIPGKEDLLKGRGRSYYEDQKKSSESVDEHGGGIGPRQHWQDLMPETVVDVKSGMARIYRRLAPKIEHYRDSFLAGQLYDELENYAELHGAEREFKQMMNGARNRAHMEYDTNPGGFQNWFWFLPFEDNDVDEAVSKKDLLAKLQKNLPKVNDPKNKHAKPVNWTGPGKNDYGYTGYQGHGMPTDKQERESARKTKGVAESNDDVKKRMSKLEALALAANRAGDDVKCKM